MTGGLSPRERLVVAGIAAATAAAAALHVLGAPALVTFVVATLALAGLAWLVSFSTEQLGERLGPAATGVMQSTLGNLPEFFIVIFALRAGETVVALNSIVGSIFANALLVLGLAIVAGARAAEDGVMRFKRHLPNDTATLLLLAVFLIVLVGISVRSSDKASHHTVAISIVGAICLLAVYASWLVPYLRADHGSAGAGTPRVPVPVAAGLLGLAGVGAAFVSDWFVAALSPAMSRLHLSDAFAGLVVVGIAGNAVENAVGVIIARKGQADLALSVIKNSVSQVAVFLFPALVLVSLLFASHLTFALPPVLIGALGLTAFLVWQITGDGEATVFEGFALIGVYVILATVVLYE